MRSPPTVMLPPVGESSPPIRLSSVVLPEPDGPISATKSPFSMSRSMPCSTSTFCLPRSVGLADVADLDQGVSSPIHLSCKIVRCLAGATTHRRAVVRSRPAGLGTTRAPAASPVDRAQLAELLAAGFTGRAAPRSPSTTNTTLPAVALRRSLPPGTSTPSWPAALAPAARRFGLQETTRARPCPGTMRGSFWSSATRTLTVALLRSAVGMIAITWAGIFQSG